MTKNKFMTELENSLKGQLPNDDITEIISDYNDIFDNGIASGKSEHEISSEIGSPASISRIIVGDMNTDSGHNDKDKDTTYNVLNLAPMSKRLGAYLIDAIVVTLLMVFLFSAGTSIYETIIINRNQTQFLDEVKTGLNKSEYGFSEDTVTDVNGNAIQITLSKDNKVIFKGSPAKYSEFRKKTGITKSNITSFSTIQPSMPFNFELLQIISFMYLLLIGLFNVITAFELWIFKGYTLGKWIVRIKVENINGRKIGFWNAIVRDGLIKCVLNTISFGTLNIVSFIIGCVRADNKAIHDLATNTRVVSIKR